MTTGTIGLKRLSVLLFVLGVLLLGLGIALTFLVGLTTMPSYLANWLFWASLPLGALPVVMLLDLAGPGSGFGLEAVLRRMLLLMPLAALLMVPVLVRPHEMFGWSMGHGFSTPFGRHWMNHGAFIGRSIGYFFIWVLLALIFLWPPSVEAIDRRRAFAAAGLFVYAISITLASVDWAMTVEPDWFSPEYGLLFAASQAAIAVSFAVLVAGGRWREMFPEPAAAFLLVAAGAWIFMHFMQYLVIWSGNKASDITWYVHRQNLGSGIVVWIGFIIGVLIPLLLLLSPPYRRRRYVLPGTALLLLCAQELAMLWLITPSLRQYFTVSGMDALEFLGIAGITLGICLWPGLLPEAAEEAALHG